MKKEKTPKIKYIRNTEALKKLKAKSQWNKYVLIYIGKKFSKDVEFKTISLLNEVNQGHLVLHYQNDPFWGQILRDLGIAKSLSEANGAGWNRKVEDGFQDLLLDGLKVVKDESYHNPKGFRPHRLFVYKDFNLTEDK